MVITENDVNDTLAAYAQHNYYGIGGSQQGTLMHGMDYNFNDSATIIAATSCRYNFVAVLPSFIASPNGQAASQPAFMASGMPYTHTHTHIYIYIYIQR